MYTMLDLGCCRTESRVLRAAIRLSYPKLKTLDERGIMLSISKLLVPRPSQRSLINKIRDISGLVVRKEVVTQQPEPKLKKGKRNRTLKNFRPEFQLYLIEGARDEVDGTIEKFKTRLVIQGFRQKSKIDYFDTYALVARISIIRLLIAMASIHNLIIHQMHVKTTFLNGELDEKALTKWHQKFNEVVLSNGYLLNQSDKCVYSKFDETGAISWASKKQTCITGSTMKSEFVSLAAAGYGHMACIVSGVFKCLKTYVYFIFREDCWKFSAIVGIESYMEIGLELASYATLKAPMTLLEAWSMLLLEESHLSRKQGRKSARDTPSPSTVLVAFSTSPNNKGRTNKEICRNFQCGFCRFSDRCKLVLTRGSQNDTENEAVHLMMFPLSLTGEAKTWLDELNEEEIFTESDEFMAMTADENSDSEFDTEEQPFEKITINTNYKIKTSLEEPPTDLKLKPLPGIRLGHKVSSVGLEVDKAKVDVISKLPPPTNIKGNSYVYDPNLNSFDCPPDSYHPAHPTYETYSYDSYGNDSQFGYDYQPQFPLNYESKPGYIENYNSYPYDSSSVPQQYPCCTRCGGPHETCQCDQLIFDEPYFTPSLSIEEPDNSLSIGDEHLDTILATESDEVIKSSVENLIPIPSESEGIPEHKCDVPFQDNSPPLDVLKDQFEDLSDSNEEFSLTDDDSFSIDKIDYVEASPLDSELVSSEVMEIVIPEVGGIDNDILLTIKDDILREKLLNVNLLIAKLEALNANPTPFSDFKTKSSSTSLNSLLEETNTFDNSLLGFKTFCFEVEEISSGSTTTHYDISLPEYKVFYDDHVKEICSGSPTTHSNYSLYASFIFDLSINLFPPADRSDFYEFVVELIHFISPPEYDCFLFKIEPNSGDFTKDVVEDISPTKELQVHNALPTHSTLQLNMKFQPSSESLFTYVVWIFLPFLVYLVAPHYLLSLRNEDTIFDHGIYNSYFSRLDVSHRCGTIKKFNTHRSHLNECPMMINGKNTPILDVPLFHLYPP
nr:zinc finger, CCHC-type [Tanacetum cinerariifolium]